MKDFEFDTDGLSIIMPSAELGTPDIKPLQDCFNVNYRPKFSTTNPTRNQNLLKRYTQDPIVAQFFNSPFILQYLSMTLGLRHPVQTGPIVSHYTSNDVTGNGYKLGFHQDWPSMGTSKNSVVCWTSLYDTSTSSHSLAIVKSSHLQGQLPGTQTDGGFQVEEQFCSPQTVIEVPAGALIFFSPWLVHGTFLDQAAESSAFKLALSLRFDDLECESWNNRNFVSAYSTIVDRDIWQS